MNSSPEVISPTAIAEELSTLEAQLGRKSLLTFTKYTWPAYEVNFHHRVVAAALDRVLAGKCRRLMIFEPPQNGKSEQVSRRFPAYALGKKPDLRIVACTYGSEWADALSMDVQGIIDDPKYRRLFPGTRLSEGTDEEKRTQGEFQVVDHRGSYVATGVGGSIGGRSADISILDDPYKNREEAESEIVRQKVWNWYTSTFAQRQFGNTGSIILCTTRWHQDDLAGHLLKLAEDNPEAEQWEVISFPAIAEVQDQYREIGQPLWPEKYPLDELRRRKAVMGEYDWASLFQQRPAPAGGGLFKEEWFKDKFVEALPVLFRAARGWDTAATELDGDWTVGVKILEEFNEYPKVDGRSVDLRSTGRFFVADVKRKQLGPAGVDALMKITAQEDGVACGQREEKEGGSSGKAVVEARAKTLVGFDYQFVQISGSKVTRSKPFRAQCEAGNVYLFKAPWNGAYLDELCNFPNGDHDDQVDGSSCSFNAVLLEPPPEKGWVIW